MSTETGIGWTDSTLNPWMGCTAVSPACDHCYAQTLVEGRFKRAEWGPVKPRVRTSAANWKLPLQWEREHKAFYRKHGRNRRVFCASLADVFDNEVDPTWRDDLFRLIAATPHLTWQLLTKRIGNVENMLAFALMSQPAPINPRTTWPWPNVWLGITVCNQQEADRDIPKLLAVPAAKRFLSIEPMLGAINLRPLRSWRVKLTCCGRDNGHFTAETWEQAESFRESYTNGPGVHPEGYSAPHHAPGHKRSAIIERAAGIDWVIAGGESGPHARPSHPDWFRSLRDQCAAAVVPFFSSSGGSGATRTMAPTTTTIPMNAGYTWTAPFIAAKTALISSRRIRYIAGGPRPRETYSTASSTKHSPINPSLDYASLIEATELQSTHDYQHQPRGKFARTTTPN